MVLLAGLAPAVRGNGFRLVSQDAAAAARGEAFVATADNPSAVHYNPAGLAGLEGHHVRAGVNGLHFDPVYQPPAGVANAGRSYRIEERLAAAPQLYYAYGLAGRAVSFGLGVHAPYGAGVEWPQDTGFRAVATEGELTYLRANPVVAGEVWPGFAVAAGLMVDRAELVLEQGLSTRLPSAIYDDYFRFEGDAVGLGYNLGVLWKVSEKVSLGATLRSGTRLELEGHTRTLRPPINPLFETGAEAEFEFPLTAVAGISWRPGEDWDIGFDVDFTDWSSIDTTTIRQRRKPRAVPQDIPLSLEWEDSWMLKLGVTRRFGAGWHASAGYLFNQNSVPDDYYSPLVADLDRHFLTLGVGRTWGDAGLDVTYQFGWSPGRRVTGAQPASPLVNLVATNPADGTYDYTSHALLVSFGMRF